MTDPSTYRSRHVDVNCQCDLVFPSEAKIAEIIENGGVRLIDLTDFDSDTDELRVVESEADTSYTAISHVWADGMGNIDYCCLPRCQLQRMVSMLQGLPPRPAHWSFLPNRRNRALLIWMDTLCIPVGAQYHQLRSKAINRMAMIYANAYIVLVIDTENSTTDSRTETLEYSYARMLFSKWNTRCWTLQEGELARRLFFWTGGRAVDVEAEIEVELSTSSFHTSFVIRKILSLRLRSLAADALRVRGPNNWRSGRRAQQRRFDEIWSELGRRSTTKSDDIHIILANSTDLLASRVMSRATPLERTKAILYGFGKFPIDLLYVKSHRPDAAKDSPDRWIPDFPGSEPCNSRVSLSIDSTGLHIEDKELGSMIVVLVKPGFFKTRFIIPVHQRSRTVWLLVNSQPIESDELDPTKYSSLCLLIDPDLRRGARLLVRDCSDHINSGTYSLLTRYDRPVDLCVIGDDSRIHKLNADLPVVAAWNPLRGCRIEIEQTFDPELIRAGVRRSLMYKFKILRPGSCSLIAIVALLTLFATLIQRHVKSLPVRLAELTTIFMLSTIVGIFVILFLRRRSKERDYDRWKRSFDDEWVAESCSHTPRNFELFRMRSYQLSNLVYRRNYNN